MTEWRVKKCPSSFLAFLRMKKLLVKDLDFTERKELEEEFDEWCNMVIDDGK